MEPNSPPLAELRARLAETEQELARMDALLVTETGAERAGALASKAALLKRRQWYLARIRTLAPVQALGVDVAEDISAGESY